ncbi:MULTISPECIES: hypothetical protein [unclassified Pseudoalteromonas]|uniref:hypothetical protein n=1 Tax=unclassified Pseudoalteromonas TaxID=194690 RepID=UPI00110BA6EB|nr:MULTISPECIES: hypothetical protein [unclassified Pseudoalteromonas]QUI70521.1 hypothetical protein GSF13_12405 [Pseudoalteromonas sp. M8]TMN33378.1 hypothetical protein CWC03_19800 [Pseudoalteromonas sp. S2755]
MGGKSKSSQSTSTNQTSTSVVNDGQFAGASNVDASRTDIRNDYDIDNSVRNDFDIDNSVRQDIDNSVEQRWSDSFNTDNSVTNEIQQDIDNSVTNEYDQSQEYSDSFNTDNSVHNNGEFAGNSGVVNILDGGAIDRAFDTADIAIQQMAGLNADLADVYSKALSGTTELSIEHLAQVTGQSIGAVTDLSADLADTLSQGYNNGLATVSELSSDVITANQELVAAMSGDLTAVHQSNIEHLTGTQSSVTEFLTKSQNENVKANSLALDRVAALAKSTSLQGQDLVAQSASSMIKYISVALGLTVAVVAVALIAGKK